MSRMQPTPPPRRIPPFDPDATDGCSLAPFLPLRFRAVFQRKLVEIIARGQAEAIGMHAACVVHDQWYYYGGTAKQRKDGDKLLRSMWKLVGAPWWFRTLGYRSVRIYGHPRFRQEGISWAHGGSIFKYGVRALAQEEIAPSEQAQTPIPVLYGHDLWPFNEPRCNCPDGVVCSVLTMDGEPYGMVCEGCGTQYSGRKL